MFVHASTRIIENLEMVITIILSLAHYIHFAAIAASDSLSAAVCILGGAISMDC